MSEEVRQALLKIPVPNYSKGEEIFNWVSHLIGVFFGLGLFGYFNFRYLNYGMSTLKYVSVLTFAMMVVVLYLVSFIYHFISPDSAYKRVFRYLDHNTIYFLIIGTYFPVVTLSLDTFSIIGIMSIEVVSAIAGLLITHFGFHNKVLSIIKTILYVVMGWVIVIFPATYTMMDQRAFLFVLLGGVAYTVGVIFYAFGSKKKWFHSVFHVFVLFGTILQFIGITFAL